MWDIILPLPFIFEVLLNCLCLLLPLLIISTPNNILVRRPKAHIVIRH